MKISKISDIYQKYHDIFDIFDILENITIFSNSGPGPGLCPPIIGITTSLQRTLQTSQRQTCQADALEARVSLVSMYCGRILLCGELSLCFYYKHIRTLLRLTVTLMAGYKTSTKFTLTVSYRQTTETNALRRNNFNTNS